MQRYALIEMEAAEEELDTFEQVIEQTTSLTVGDIRGLRAVFNMYADKPGHYSASLPPTRAQHVLHMLGYNDVTLPGSGGKDSALDFHALLEVVAAEKGKSSSVDDALKQCFRFMDPHDAGLVTAPQLATFMNSMGIDLGTEDSAALVELMSAGLPDRFKQKDMLEFMAKTGKAL